MSVPNNVFAEPFDPTGWRELSLGASHLTQDRRNLGRTEFLRRMTTRMLDSSLLAPHWLCHDSHNVKYREKI